MHTVLINIHTVTAGQEHGKVGGPEEAGEVNNNNNNKSLYF